MKKILFFILLQVCLKLNAQETPSIKTRFPLKWKADIGMTTFKTNMQLHEGLLVVGSNGRHYRDWMLDRDNGVYLLDPATGKILQHFAHESLGDMDVNGVAAYCDKLYFGNDNDEFLCYNLKSEQLWRVPVSGDVEAQPVMIDINCNGRKELIFATETGEIAALDALNGNTLWSFKIKDFTGWKKTDSRFLFKIGAHFSSGNGFVSKPAVVDLNGDNIPDLIYNGRDDYTYAINGKNGQLLWKFKHEIFFIANAPLVTGSGKNTKIYLTELRLDENKRYREHLVQLNEKGKVQKRFPATYHYSRNYTPVLHNGKIYSANNDTLVVLDPASGKIKMINISRQNKKWYYRHDNITAPPVFMDFLGKGTEQIMLVDQYGFFSLFDAVTFKPLLQLKLPEGTETQPLIADINGDGKLEIVVSCYDGKLYCYDLNISTDKVLSKK